MVIFQYGIYQPQKNQENQEFQKPVLVDAVLGEREQTGSFIWKYI